MTQDTYPKTEGDARPFASEKFTEATRIPMWDPETDDVLVCRQVRQETHDVKTFLFSGREPRDFRFYPGQHMTFELPVEGMIFRSYTISASAARPYRIEITVKRVPGGPGSNWLHDYMVPGKEINVSGPAGEFTTDATADHKVLFISAGSGITPMMSMTRTACDLSEPSDLHFIHAARSPSDIIFREELALLAAQNPGLKLGFTCDTASAQHSWTGYTGRLNMQMLSLMTPDFMERKIFCCGPASFMDGVRNMLQSTDFAMERYYEESFDFGAETAGTVDDPTAAPEISDQTFFVSFSKTGHVVECGPGITLLSAAREAGLLPMSSCQRGICGTCKSILHSGEVDMQHGGGIRQREIDQGKILICCATPLSDVVVEL
ncbi:3-ketosteroid-9-alpha-hydroxylase reductase subunit [Pseudovibrio axinellae]|uniref:3-ketosteroid-9-alpha-hydroxylase reductase subunit n=1 Tax=Pseudovibrio axinellae TaxID=989403 RepID=A0A165VTC7_9HYPH|nr:hybrid-cluster NAD(P)-dependent oxidoreductase [Pseudovibrio axinellae]KZL15414.1 3-ketosteroid-9-alpha-hydroxylase reductase subunit [Pseudovibrio axinellae]SER55453.1 Ferredoxin-NADP reductase [Pseudovibrio axinellae]